MARMDWFRLYFEARTDRKLATLSDPEFRVWFNLLCFSAEQTERGAIVVDDYSLLALETSTGDTDLLKQTIGKLQRLRIIALCSGAEEEPDLIVFIHFKDRQYDKPSDHPERVSDRVKRHRGNQGVTETPCNAEKRPVTPVTPREEKKRIEEKREEERSASARAISHSLDDLHIDRDLYTLQLRQHGATPDEIAYAESELTRRKADARKWQARYMWPIIEDLRADASKAPPPVKAAPSNPFAAVDAIRAMAAEHTK